MITVHEVEDERQFNSRTEYQSLFYNMPQGFALLEILYDEKCKPINYRLLSVNPAFEKLTGLKAENITGKHTKDVFPEVESDWIERFEAVVLTGESITFESFSRDLNRFYQITAYSPAKNQIAIILVDITEQILAQDQTRRNEERLKHIIEILNYPAKTEQQLLDFGLEKAILLTSSKIGYIYLYNEDLEQFILNAWSKEVLSQCSILNPQTTYDLNKTGCWGEAVRQRKPIVLNDFQSAHPLKRGYPEGHAPLYKFLTVPIFCSEKIVAVAGVANKETDYTESDILQLTLLMDSVWNVVDQRRTRKALSATEELYRRIVTTANEGIVMLDRYQRITYVNDRFGVMFGISPKEVIGQSTEQAFLKNDIELNKVKVAGHQNGKSSTYVQRLVNRKGEVLWAQVSASPLFAENGSYDGTLLLITDITESKQVEEENARISMMLDVAPSLVIIHDIEGNVLYANQHAYNAHQYTRDEFLKINIADLLSFKIDAQTMQRIRHIDQQEQSFEAVHVRKDGSLLPLMVNTKLVQWGSGTAVLSVATDLSEIKRVEDALLKSEEKFRNLFNNSEVGMFRTNLNGTELLDFNDKFLQIFGYTREEIQKNTALISWADNPDYCEAIDKLAVNNRVNNFECKMLNKRGEYRNCLVSLIIYKEQEILEGSIIDITEQKLAEEKRRKYEEHIQRSQKLDSLGVLAGGIAHDFNNLLGGMFGFLDLALEECSPNDKKIADYLNKALITFNRAKDLTLQLLTFAKGGQPYKKIGLLTPILQNNVSFALSGSNVSCQYEIDKDLWSCAFDENQIAQVIDNIVINSLQAMPQGGTVKIIAKNEYVQSDSISLLKKDKYIKLSITDSGIGIPPDILPKIFEPFFTTKQKANGLGLATAYSIVKKHDGEIIVESVPNKGTSVHIFLPASQTPVNEEKLLRPQKIVHQGSGKILLMDDEESILETMGLILTSMGYTVEYAFEGNRAFEMFTEAQKSSNPYVAVFLDLTIPGGLGGKDVIQQIRKVDSTVVTVVSSGYSDNPIMSNPVAYGFTERICKPCRKDEVAIMMNKLFKHENVSV